ncbi:hypothetical protein EVB87_182 [Rhizobium phage RHph_N28_1]|nr:hypothetical protein EVB87_182 [Rhizobium phage RHph_N28_1]QIG74211.1 hypothetical protein EVC07_183 [Rhizobium phage RHph_N42]QIG74818.1 hypothetical protein EVC12_183 [Rhizobium phage RHph_I42]QXV73870.1 hypothetical protein [Rhizobium phage RHph_N46]
MKFHEMIKRASTQRERERDKFANSFCLEQMYSFDEATVKVIDNSNFGYITVDVLEAGGSVIIPDDKIVRIKTDKALFTHQEPWDRHLLQVVGVVFVIRARQTKRVPWPQRYIASLTYGLETWERGFHWPY